LPLRLLGPARHLLSQVSRKGCPTGQPSLQKSVKVFYLAALAARMASVSSGVTLNRSPQMP
jgi:hypothetical protein